MWSFPVRSGPGIFHHFASIHHGCQADCRGACTCPALSNARNSSLSEGGEVQAYLAQKTGQRTVPNIFVKGQHLGGCDDLMRASQSGELNKLVASL